MQVLNGHILADQRTQPLSLRTRVLSFVLALTALGNLGYAQSILTNVPAGGVAIAVNETTNKVYVAGASGVSVIDGVTNTPTQILSGNSKWIVVNPVTNKIYSHNQGASSNQVVVIDGATNAITTIGAAIAVGDSAVMAINKTTVTKYFFMT